MKQGFGWWCYQGRGLSNEELFATAVEIGYEGVELVPDELLPVARRAGLEIVAQNGHDSIEVGLNDPSQHDRIFQEVRKKLELCQEFKIQKLIVFSGNRRPGLTESDGQKYAIEGLTRLAPLAEEAEVDLVLELLNSQVDHVGYQGDTTKWLVPIIEEVDSPRVKILYDIYHAQIMEGHLIETVRTHHARFGHYHTAGNPGRRDLDEEQEIFYPPVFRAIRDTGYTGYVGHEFHPKGDVRQALQHAFDLLNRSLT